MDIEFYDTIPWLWSVLQNPRYWNNEYDPWTYAPRSKEHSKKISDALKGKHPSETTRMRMSEAHTGSKNPIFGKRWGSVSCSSFWKVRKLVPLLAFWNRIEGKISPKCTMTGRRNLSIWKGGKIMQLRRMRAKRRLLPLPESMIILNKYFGKAHLHHTGIFKASKNMVGIWVPAEIQRQNPHSIWSGKGLERINGAVLEWLLEN